MSAVTVETVVPVGATLVDRKVGASAYQAVGTSHVYSTVKVDSKTWALTIATRVDSTEGDLTTTQAGETVFEATAPNWTPLGKVEREFESLEGSDLPARISAAQALVPVKAEAKPEAPAPATEEVKAAKPAAKPRAPRKAKASA